MSSSLAPAATTLFHNVWPVGLGATFGQGMADAAQWRYPWLAAIVTGALVQVLIALMRAWFSERRDLLQTMKAMLAEQREYLHDMIRNEKEERHSMANRAMKAEFKLAMIAAGIPLSRMPEPPSPYPEVEDPANAKRNQD